jgi:hypothetical protein
MHFVCLTQLNNSKHNQLVNCFRKCLHPSQFEHILFKVRDSELQNFLVFSSCLNISFGLFFFLQPVYSILCYFIGKWLFFLCVFVQKTELKNYCWFSNAHYYFF